MSEPLAEVSQPTLEEGNSSETKNFIFLGKGDEFFKIWIVNLVLTILTVGIYAAWAKVRTRRYFYGNTFFDDANFEYHAKPIAILIGKVVAIMALVIYVLVTEFFPVFGMLILIPLALITPWVIWRSFQFNARMTSYRNIRFAFAGSLKRAYRILFWIPVIPFLIGATVLLGMWLFGMDVGAREISSVLVLSFVVLMLMTPYLQKLITVYRVQYHQYGQGEFQTDLSSKRFYRIYLMMVVLSLVIYAALGVLAFFIFSLGIGGDFSSHLGSVEEGSVSFPPMMMVGLLFIYIAFIVAGIWLNAYLKAHLRNYVFSNTELKGVLQLHSSIDIEQLFKIMFVNLLLMIVTLGLAYPWTKIRLAKYYAESTSATVKGDLSGFVEQQQSHQSALGDELGEAFDMDMGVGL